MKPLKLLSISSTSLFVLFCIVLCISQHGSTATEETKTPGKVKSFVSRSTRYAWACREEVCKKVDRNSGLKPREEALSLGVCKLTCGNGGTLWPIPTGKVEISKETLNFYPQKVEFGTFQAEEPINTMLGSASQIFNSYFLKMHPDYAENVNFTFPIDEEDSETLNNKILINIGVVWTDTVIKLGIDESYTLALVTSDDGKTVQVSIIGNTYFGVRHALETLSQLIVFNDNTQTLTIVQQAVITDKPAFTYRGILMDTARNFIPIPALQRLIDGLSYNKLNFLHWHITDTHSFPFQSTRRPIMTEYGAYSGRKVYSVQDMKALIEYGRLRGVKILPEFDAPAHVGNGWEWGPSNGLGNLAVCVNQEPWWSYCVEPPCGQLNPTNENMYTVLEDVYKDFLDIFEKDIFHMGGDEVNLNCWNATEEIQQWMIENELGVDTQAFINLWGTFQLRAYDALKRANSGNDLDVVLWTSELTSEKHILQQINNKSSYIIQIWSNGNEEEKIIPFLIENGYRTIFTQVDAWYFDCGFGAWLGDAPNNWCSPYKGWQSVYMNSPIKLLGNYTGDENAQEAYRNGLILGGEAAMWSEQVDETSVESKIWPRGSALAERLWSDPATNSIDAEPRMIHNRQRLVERGLRPDRLQPEWCYQNENGCPGPT